MSIFGSIDLERINILDFLLPQRWARRLSTQIAKWPHRYTGLFGRGGSFTDITGAGSTPTVIGGLEVSLSSGVIYVSPGQLLSYPAGNPFTPGGFAARPASYTFQDPAPVGGPARPEGDDDTVALYDNPYARPVPVTFGPTLAVDEWWVVYAVGSTATVETDTARVVFNETTGNFDAASQAKVTKRTLTFGLARGPASAGFPALPGGAIPLGALLVDALSVDVTDASVFDLRSLREASREPNQIGGCWEIYRLVGTPRWRGHVWAHHRGEVLEARNLGAGMPTDALCSPGAAFDGAASPTAPKIAWLYLARAANGSVPRLKQAGNEPIASDSLPNHKFYQAGVLVLSPVRPRLGLGDDKNETAGRWDMQNSAPIALPTNNDVNPPATHYNFSSQVAAEGDAICVGMVVYNGLSGGKPTVLDVSVTEDGWMRGQGVSARSKGDLATSPLANATVSVVGTAIALGATRAAVGSYRVPIDGVQIAHFGVYSEAQIVWENGGSTGTDGVAYVYATDRFSGAIAHAIADGVVLAKGTKIGTGTVPTGDAAAWVEGVRLPYGRPLFTLRSVRQLAGVPRLFLVFHAAKDIPLLPRNAAVLRRWLWRVAHRGDLRSAFGLHCLAENTRVVAPRQVALGTRGARAPRCRPAASANRRSPRRAAGAARSARAGAPALPEARTVRLACLDARASWASARLLLARDAGLRRAARARGGTGGPGCRDAS